MNYLVEKTLQFINSIYNTKNIPNYVADLISSQISALKKITVITKDFSVGIWEGYYDDVFDGPIRGAFNTADVAFHYAPALLILYPDLLKNLLEQLYKFRLDYNTEEFVIIANSILENFIEYKRAILKDPSLLSDFKKIVETVKDIVKKTGKDPKDRIPHFFRIPNRRSVQGYHLLDASIKYLLMVYLYSRYTGDTSLMKTTEEVIQSIVRTHLKDGLPYHFTPAGIDQEWKTTFNFFRNQDMRDNARSLLGYTTSEISYQTFDDWSMIGFVSYTSILWYSAIKLLGKQKLLEEAENGLNKLWNGKYYDLWYDPESGYRDTACLSSQLMGVWYCRLVGESCFDEDKERKIMSEIFKNNFIEGEGLINGRYINKPRPSEVGNIPYFNNTGLINRVGSQMDTPWTGVEFAFASHLLYLGMEDEALKILKEVYDRYETAGMFWKHVEWGAYYSRPLSAFSITLAYAGISYDGGRKLLKIRPKKKNFTWIILLPSFWGIIDYDEENRLIKIKVIKTKDGVADVNAIETNFPIGDITINGEKTRFPLRIKDGDEILIR
ncbi:hypothetical protein DJ524_07920 [Sulfolobus sp. D5]|nr:hypothetical protein DJ524_07920 [Sulfolobus sp. D5]